MYLRTCVVTLVVVTLFDNVRSQYSSLHENETVHTTPWGAAGAMPKILKIKLMLEAGHKIDLTWTKTEQYLANRHLPVITVLTDVHLNVLHGFGEFVMYQDVKKCSAVVYFKKSNSLFGIIRTNYHIMNLPYAFNEQGEYQLGVVGEPYVKQRSYEPMHIPLDLLFPTSIDNIDTEENRPSTSDSNRSGKRKIDCRIGPSTKHQRTDQDLVKPLPDQETNPTTNEIADTGKTMRRRDSNEFYLETLIFVSRDIVDLFKKFCGENRYIHTIARYYIIYFNAVDMIFKQMGTKQKLHINIAKIVLENELLLPFDFLSKNHVQYSDIIAKLPQYLKTNREWYPPDSFDYVFIHTRNSILDGHRQMTGLTKPGVNMYDARKNDRFYDAVPVSVVQYQNHFADYPTVVHQIGQILNLEMNPQKIMQGSSRYCYNIMQKDGPKCDNCLIWNIRSKAEFTTFVRKNPYRCFLLNSPRSLLSPGPHRFVTPHRQCQCFGYDSYITYDNGRPERWVKFYGCNEPLQCQKHPGSQSEVENTVLPFDGTPCTDTKVCWNQQCIAIQK